MRPTRTEAVLPPMDSVTTDFDFLQGSFDVTSRRLRDPFDPQSGWAQARATSIARTLFAGAVSVDEMWFPDVRMYGMSLRVFDPNTRQWAVYWVNSTTGQLQPPVRGVWEAGRCWLTGPDEYAGRPIHASYSWTEVTGRSAHWEQCFSVDGGATWQPNWTMQWVRRESTPDHGAGARITSDFEFLAGRWHVHHRRRPDPLTPGSPWTEFDSSQAGFSYFNGAVSVDELGLAEPGHRGLTFRVYDPAAGQWSIYWLNSRTGQLALPPVTGRFTEGAGTFFASEHIDGKDVRVRFVWDEITATSARWRQAFSLDRGAPWSENWDMRLHRLEGPA